MRTRTHLQVPYACLTIPRVPANPTGRLMSSTFSFVSLQLEVPHGRRTKKRQGNTIAV